MTNYGFLIDNRKCIGCHACSTACKSENEVPLGVYRTWVKYVEKGQFPDVRRSFQVTRCNHCANPPCVRICPVTAMYQRSDGIVEFDPRICIGCKACMQACPYDAIYIDPESHTAAKCHFCSHRVEIGLEPACVVVCPERAIIAGDLSDPHSEISRLVAREQVSVRKPEQGTAPKLFYIEADEVTLNPAASALGPSLMWADLITEQQIEVFAAPLSASRGNNGGDSSQGTPPTAPGLPSEARNLDPGQRARTAFSGATLRPPQPQGIGSRGGPIHFAEGSMAANIVGAQMPGAPDPGAMVPGDHMVQTAYNAQHKIPWHWPVPAYLVTKSIGSGIFMLLALFFGLGWAEFDLPLALAGNFVALGFIGLTTLLLVLDLDRPERFFTILTRPQWRSWLTRGAFILIGFSTLVGLWFLVEGAAALGWLAAPSTGLRTLFMMLGFPLAVLAAIYTAFLFGQAEGRDLWQSGLLPVHLLLQALMTGSAALLVIGGFTGLAPVLKNGLLWVFGITLAADLFVTLAGEFGMPHASEGAARAAHQIRHGKYRRHFWLGSVLLGHLVPLALLLLGAYTPVGLAFAAAGAIAGLYLFEFAFVMAPQELPNS